MINDNKNIEYNNTHINELIRKYNNKLLNYSLITKSTDLTDIENELTLLFLKAHFDNNWILLTRDIVETYFGFLRMTKFVDDHLIYFFIETDYKIVKKNHPLVKKYCESGSVNDIEIFLIENRTHFCLVTKNCFKQLISKYSKDIEHYIDKIELLVSNIIPHIKEYN